MWFIMHPSDSELIYSRNVIIINCIILLFAGSISILLPSSSGVPFFVWPLHRYYLPYLLGWIMELWKIGNKPNFDSFSISDNWHQAGLELGVWRNSVILRIFGEFYTWRRPSYYFTSLLTVHILQNRPCDWSFECVTKIYSIWQHPRKIILEFF